MKLYLCLFIALFSSLTCNAKALDSGVKNFTAGLVSVYRDYSETLPEKKDFKSDEYGPLMGVKLDYTSYGPQTFYFNFDFSVVGGSTTYDGMIQDIKTGKKAHDFKDKTSNTIIDFNFNFGKDFYSSNSVHTFIPYVGLGGYGWNRELGNGEAYKKAEFLDEVYAASYFNFGLKHEMILHSKVKLGFNFDFHQMLSGLMEMKNLGLYNVTLPEKLVLGNRLHYTLGSRLSLKVKEGLDVNLSPFYQSKDFGRSNTLYYGGYSFTEPESKTHVFGVNASLAMAF